MVDSISPELNRLDLGIIWDVELVDSLCVRVEVLLYLFSVLQPQLSRESNVQEEITFFFAEYTWGLQISYQLRLFNP